MKFDELLSGNFASAASRGLSEILGRGVDEVRPLTDKSVDIVLDHFAEHADDSGARERLYEAVKNSDERVADDPNINLRGRDRQATLVAGNNKLTDIVGSAGKNRMAEKLRATSGLSKKEAEDVLGYVSPGVLGVLKKHISSGAVANSAAGLSGLLASRSAGTAAKSTGNIPVVSVSESLTLS